MKTPHLSPAEVAARLAQEPTGVRLVDVREPSEHAAGRIAGAQLVPLAVLAAVAASWVREEAVILYCQSGRRSARGLEELAALGFTQATHLEGGYAAWVANGRATEKDARAPWALERQVRLAVGLLVLLFTLLGLYAHPAFFLLDLAISGGLIFSALTNTCGLALVLTKMPWNRVS